MHVSRSACSAPRTGRPRICPSSACSPNLSSGGAFRPRAMRARPNAPIPSELEVTLPEYGETLRPDFAVRELEPQNSACPWQLLVRILEPGDDFDRIIRGHGRLEASAHGRMERLLRQTRVPAGLLFNGRTLRLVSAPYGESSGWLDFHVADMAQTAGRPISTALRLLLNQQRLLSLPRAQRLAALLERQPQIPERSQRAPVRAGAARTLRIASWLSVCARCLWW